MSLAKVDMSGQSPFENLHKALFSFSWRPPVIPRHCHLCRNQIGEFKPSLMRFSDQQPQSSKARLKNPHVLPTRLKDLWMYSPGGVLISDYTRAFDPA